MSKPAHRATRAAAHRRLLEWYRGHGRDLPWRHTRDPYAILVAEIMLQQTQVDRVIPKFHEFLDVFPTVAALTAAPRDEVIRRWAPLGYNLRAVRLHEIARQVVECFSGRLPSTAQALQQLKGLGPYTAGAVACFGFDERTPILDTNIRRVLGRFFDGVDLGRSTADEQRGWRLAAEALPEQHYYDWNQALMDLGATICTARRPACLVCPLREQCCYANQAASNTDADRARPVPTATARRVAERCEPYRTAPFEGSNRYFRGRVVDALRSIPPGAAIPVRELGGLVKAGFGDDDLSWVLRLLEGLERDGLVTIERSRSGPFVRLPH